MPNSPAPTLIVSPATSALGGADDRLDQVLDGEQLVAVAAVAEHVDAAALADPVEEDLEDAEPLGPDERLGAHDHDLQAPAAELAASPARPRSSTRRSGRRRRAGRPRRSGASPECRRRPSTRSGSRGARRRRARPRAASPSRPTLTERIASREPRIGRAAAACTSTSAPATSRAQAAGSRTSPRSSSTDASSSGSCERSDVEGAHLAAVSRGAGAQGADRGSPAPPEIAQRIDGP